MSDKVRFILEYHATPHIWSRMYDRDGHNLPEYKTIQGAINARAAAKRRHKPYGRDFAYRIIKITREVVA